MDHADVVIIGGGIAGFAAAYHLTSHKFSVTLFEKSDHACSGASGNPQALLNPFVSLQDTIGARFMREAYDQSISFFEEHALAVGFQQKGIIHVPIQGKYQRYIEKKAKVDDSAIAIISAEEASERASVSLSGKVLFYPKSGTLPPTQLASFYKSQSAEKLKCFFSESAKIEKNNHDELIVSSTKRKISCKVILLASAYEAANEPLTSRLRLEAVRGEVCFLPTLPAIEKLSVPIACNGYLMPQQEGLHLIGSTYDHGEFDLEPSFEKQKQLGERISKALPSLFSSNPVVQKLQGRVSFRTSTHDRLPYIGALSEGVYATLGHGSRGMQTSYLAGKLIAEALSSQEAIPEAVLPSRLAN